MLTSIILGTIIGMVISITLILQFNLFSEIPFKLTVKYILISFNFSFHLNYMLLCVFQEYYYHYLGLISQLEM